MTRIHLLLIALVVLAALTGEILWGDAVIWGAYGDDSIIWGN